MRERPALTTLPGEPRRGPGDWLAELRHILLDGTGPAEGRLEQFLDRMERRP